MEVHLDDYVDRWMINYIVYHKANFESRGDLAAATTLFTAKKNDALSSMKSNSREMQAQLARLVGELPGTGLDILYELEQGNLLQESFRQIADSMNETIDQEANRIFGADLGEAYSYANMLSAGAPDLQRLESFLDLLVSTSQKILTYDNDFIASLGIIASQFNNSFNTSAWQEKWPVPVNAVITESDMAIAQNIVNLLQNAANKMSASANGKLSKTSFASTIRNIFQGIIGENLSRIILSEMAAEGEEKLSEFEEALIRNSDGKITLSHGTYGPSGRKRTSISKRTSKVDLCNSDAFHLSVLIDGREVAIELASNISVKWGALTASGKVPSKITLLNRKPFNTIFQNGEEKYFTSNLIAHRFNFPKEYEDMRKAYAASFFNEALMGSGEKVSLGRTGSYLDTAQFLMINGRIYSMMDIVDSICNEAVGKGKSTGSLSFNGINKLVAESGWVDAQEGLSSWTPATWAALKRSEIMNKVINRITISLTFNANMIKT